MKEYGSNFELSYTPGVGMDYDLKSTENRLFLRSAREGFLLIGEMAIQKGIQTVYMPALCCVSMIQSFVQLNYRVEYYRLKRDLSIDIDYLDSILKDNSLIVVMKYHGLPTYNIKEIMLLLDKYNNTQLVQDCTQHVFTKALYDDSANFHIGSIRKWIAIPDGAFVSSQNYVLGEANVIVDDENIFVKTAYNSMIEKTNYIRSGNLEVKMMYREKNAFCMNLLRNYVSPHRISEKSCYIMKNDIDLQDVIHKRNTNYKVLGECLYGFRSDILRFTVEQECPLCFPIYVNNRDKIQKALAQKGVFCQVLWPIPTEATEVCKNSADYSAHMLAIPCDQRYSPDDMTCIVNHIKDVLIDIS